MIRSFFWVTILGFYSVSSTAQQTGDYPILPVPFTNVTITDNFWKPRLETNRTVTIPYDFKKCEETGRIQNFEVAAGMKQGAFKGIRFDDSDVFKIMEGAAYSLAIHPDTALDAYMDDLIVKIAGAQEDDGYLYTNRTIDPQNPARDAGKERWSFLDQSHELYNVGHMYEAAVAHYLATGKHSFLDVAIKNADLIANTFGADNQYGVPGHQEIEIGLVKLYRVTGNEKYLATAKYFLDTRGRKVENAKYPQQQNAYFQSHLPVVEQDEAVGHAVRAIYMYSGMADVAAITGDKAYIAAIEKIWEDVVYRKLYITGGVGARHEGETFGSAYELPNLTAYNETCAAIANCLWNYRMFLLKGESKYFDVLERTLYNGFLSGIAITGDSFFYPNPLACDGNYAFNQGAKTRKEWFDCSCCPSNIVRFLPSLPGYVYATKGDNVFVNLYMSSEAIIEVNGTKVHITQTTSYPWEGTVKIKIDPSDPVDLKLRLRIPGWAVGKPVPGDLYTYYEPQNKKVTASVNGTAVPLNMQDGYLNIDRKWQKGDEVILNLPMKINLVVSHEKVNENYGRLAMERGPLVYCAEGIDNRGHVFNLLLPEYAPITVQWRPDLLGGLNTLKAKVPAFRVNDTGEEIKTRSHNTIAIPYYAWSHRGVGEMNVWFPKRAKSVKIDAE
jgi:uncharacterized protein